MVNHLPEIMTIAEAANFRTPVSSLYKLAQQMKIPSSKVGRHWHFWREFINHRFDEPAQGSKTTDLQAKGPQGK